MKRLLVMANHGAEPILEVKNLKTHFFTDKGVVQAVKGVSFALENEQTLGIVGESGCGKSVTASSIMQLIKSPPGKIVDGEIIFRRQKRRAETIDIAQLDPKGVEMRSIRGGEISMIFQEPMTSLNPLHPVGRQISEVVELHQGLGRKESLKVAIDMLDRVRIADPEERVRQYPHQLSGGMRQRVMIALALSCNPSILIADEPTTALDVTIQAQIIDLMEQLQEDFGSSIIIITHNLGVVSQMADYVAVMYFGRIVEYGTTVDIFRKPQHPYKEMKDLRKEMRMIFQDPFSSLNPRLTVRDIIAEPLVIHGEASGDAITARVAELMESVGLKPAYMGRYPHEFSGGQRQRIGVARTLALNPRLIVADEPVSALDVSVQAQVLNLLQTLKDDLRLTFIFISHDLSVVEHICDRIAVIYVGKLVELAPTDELLRNPRHPYTEALVSAVPPADPLVKMERVILDGDVPSPANPPSGCVFHPRCRYAQDVCQEQEPPLVQVGPEHSARCHFADELDLQGVADVAV